MKLHLSRDHSDKKTPHANSNVIRDAKECPLCTFTTGNAKVMKAHLKNHPGPKDLTNPEVCIVLISQVIQKL